jgi:hypothetical protein
VRDKSKASNPIYDDRSYELLDKDVREGASFPFIGADISDIEIPWSRIESSWDEKTCV